MGRMEGKVALVTGAARARVGHTRSGWPKKVQISWRSTAQPMGGCRTPLARRVISRLRSKR